MTDGSLLLHNGVVYTLDEALSRYSEIEFRDGVVAAVGSDTRSADAVDETLDLEGRVVVPGFNDAHTHVTWVGLIELETDLGAAASRAEALDLLRENASTTDPGDWVLGFRYDESTWDGDEQRYLRREELDAVSDAHPIAAQRVDGHTISLNSAALDRLQFPAEGVLRDNRGEPTGVVVEDAATRVQKATYPGPEKAKTVLAVAVRRAHELGLTSVQDMAGLTTPDGPGDPMHAAFFSAWRECDLPLRLGYYVHVDRADALSTLEIASGFGDEWLRVLGVKVFADGAIGSRSAKLSGEFADDPGNDGQFVVDPDRLPELFRAAARANQQVATHAIGDQAIGAVLDAYERVLAEYDVPEPRLRVEHAELATDDQIERMAELGVVASMQPNFVQWSAPDGLYERRLGEAWLRRNNRFRTMREADVPLAFGSDTMPSGPLYGIHQAVNARSDEQRLSVEAAIRAYTRGGAFAEREESRKGALEPDALADAVVLDRDPFDHPAEIADIDVTTTIVGGDVVYTGD